MKFIEDEPNENCNIRRLVSEEGKWEVGLYQVLFGVRVALSRIGGCTYTMNYCAGADEGFQNSLLKLVIHYLEPLPEDTPVWWIEQWMPRFETKPINTSDDFVCGMLLFARQCPVMTEADDKYPSITCPTCKLTSYNTNDIEQKYCGHCHQFHEHMEVNTDGKKS